MIATVNDSATDTDHAARLDSRERRPPIKLRILAQAANEVHPAHPPSHLESLERAQGRIPRHLPNHEFAIAGAPFVRALAKRGVGDIARMNMGHAMARTAEVAIEVVFFLRVGILWICFTLAGSSGLIYEILWTRKLGFIFGSTELALSVCLWTAYLAGLALGSYFAGRIAIPLDHLGRDFAAMQLAIGVCGLLGLLLDAGEAS